MTIGEVDASQRHDQKTHENDGVNPAHRQVDRHHPMIGHNRNNLPGKPGSDSKENNFNDIDQPGGNHPQPGRHESVEDFDKNVRIFADGHDRPGEADENEQITGNFLSPGDRRIKDIAGEKLGKNDPGQHPENYQDKVVLNGVIAVFKGILCFGVVGLGGFPGLFFGGWLLVGHGFSPWQNNLFDGLQAIVILFAPGRSGTVDVRLDSVHERLAVDVIDDVSLFLKPGLEIVLLLTHFLPNFAPLPPTGFQ